MVEMMQPSLSAIIVHFPELRSLLPMVTIGIVGLAAGILILETIAYCERK
jgi:hypothetical protein